jgi:hypothetical protein
MSLRSRAQWWLTLPTAASPSRTSLTLLLGLGAALVESVIEDGGVVGRLARKLRPTPCSDSSTGNDGGAGKSVVVVYQSDSAQWMVYRRSVRCRMYVVVWRKTSTDVDCCEGSRFACLGATRQLRAVVWRWGWWPVSRQGPIRHHSHVFLLLSSRKTLLEPCNLVGHSSFKVSPLASVPSPDSRVASRESPS